MKYQLRKKTKCNHHNLFKVGSLFGGYSDVNKAYKMAQDHNDDYNGCGCSVEVIEVSEQ